MDNTKINSQLGTKWFTFYTKVRPWFACILSISFIADFVEYTDVYFSYWWLVLYALFSFAAPVLCLVVFAKSQGDYRKFVSFVTGVLFFEAINISYQVFVQQYIEGLALPEALVVFAVTLVASYFLWFRLNVKYFTKRIISSDVQGIEIEKTATIARNHYCTNCGSALADGVNFCGNCGVKVISE